MRIVVSKCRLKFCFGSRFLQLFVNILMRTVSEIGEYTQEFYRNERYAGKTFFGVGYLPWSGGLFSNRLNLLR